MDGENIYLLQIQYYFQGRHFLKLHPLSFGANYVLPGAQVRAFIGNLTQFSVQLYTVSEVVGSFLDEIKDEGGTIHFCGALDKVSNDYVTPFNVVVRSGKVAWRQ